MKCISCGKNFDEEKYYRICPKCGTYNNVKKATPDFSQGSRQTGGSCGNGQMGTSGNNASGGQQDPFWQELHGGNRGQSTGSSRTDSRHMVSQIMISRIFSTGRSRRCISGDRGKKEKKPNRPLVISLIILVIIGIVLFIISMVLVAGQDAGRAAARTLFWRRRSQSARRIWESLLCWRRIRD